MKQNIKKILFTVGISAVLIVVISTSTFGSDIRGNQQQNPQGQNASNSVSEPAYIIGIYSGYVAVFKYGSDDPFKITDVPVSTLTEGDILILTKGIKVADDEELNKRLEDYTG